jgi:hypothetical protein
VYFVTIIALTIVLPIGSAIAEAYYLQPTAGLVPLIGKWTAFFATGVRLLIAGLRQVFQPRFTLKQIFEIDDEAPQQIVQELGFANLAMAALGLMALLHPMLTFAAALVGGLYYGLAGLKHVSKGERNSERTTAMATDLWVFAVLGLYVAVSGVL